MVGRMGSFQPPGTPAMVLAMGVQQLGLATPQRGRLPRPNLPRTPSTRQSTRRSTARRDVYRIPASLMRMIEQGLPPGPQPLVPGGNGTGAAAAPSPGVAAAAPLPGLAAAAYAPGLAAAANAPGAAAATPELAAATTPQLAAAAVPGLPPPPPAGFPLAPCYECGAPTHRARDCPHRQTRIQHGAVCKPWQDSRGERGGWGGGCGRGSRGASAGKPEGRSQGSGQSIVYNFQHYFK